jgi:hypothetical protein
MYDLYALCNRFWYVSLVACYRDPLTCQWKHTGNHTVIDYDIWLVNGNPYTKNQNPLEYQFSFDRQVLANLIRPRKYFMVSKYEYEIFLIGF